jgi:hypothetical protein
MKYTSETMAESVAWAEALCNGLEERLKERYRAFEYWDARYQKAQMVNYWNVRRETGYSMEYIIEQREIFRMKFLDADISNF